MAKDPVITPSALDKFNLSYEYDVTWPEIHTAIGIRTDK
jgi:hypothetical protein